MIARPHIARVISEKYGYSYQEIFDQYLNNDSKAYVEIERLETKAGIELLHRNQAIVVLAHPMYLSTTSVGEIIDMGIAGIELYYPNQNQSEILKEIENKSLLLTGGSDYHGELYENQLGDSFPPQEQAKRLLKKLQIEKFSIS